MACPCRQIRVENSVGPHLSGTLTHTLNLHRYHTTVTSSRDESEPHKRECLHCVIRGLRRRSRRRLGQVDCSPLWFACSTDLRHPNIHADYLPSGPTVMIPGRFGGVGVLGGSSDSPIDPACIIIADCSRTMMGSSILSRPRCDAFGRYGHTSFPFRALFGRICGPKIRGLFKLWTDCKFRLQV